VIDLLRGIFDGITCLLANFAVMIVWALVETLNYVVLGLAAIIAPLVALMPEMPDPPSLPSEFSSAAGWVAWVFPVSTAVDILTFFVGVWLAWQLLAIAMRWAKAL
jgi:hypothetical protein